MKMFSKVLSNRIYILHVLAFILLLASCTPAEKKGDVIVRVFDQELRESDVIADLGKENFDKQLLKQQYIDSWIKKQLLLAKASSSTKNLKEINRLVEHYRESLLIQKHKDNYVKKKLNLEISDTEFTEAYDVISTEYKLRTDIFKGELVIVPANHPSRLDIVNFFKKKKFDEWKNSIGNQMDFIIGDTINWLNWAKLSQHIPHTLMEESDLEEDKNLFLEDGKQLFFIRIYELVDKSELAPLSYMKPKLEAAILERKKAKLLEEYNAELYKSALKNNKIQQ